MTSFWQDNLAALKRYHPDLFNRVSVSDHKPVGEIISSPVGLPTLRFAVPGGLGPLAYDGQDPWQDAAVHLQTIEPGSRGLALFIGMGLGYGALRVLRERPTLGMLVILEPCLDLFMTALQHVDLRPLITDSKVRMLIGDIDFGSFEKIVARIASLEDTHILRHVPSVRWREDLYLPLDHRAFVLVNQLNAAGGTTRRAGEQFFLNRLANLTLLRHSTELGALKDLFLNKPAVLVAAGPSLDRSMAALKDIVGRCVLFCVDSALSPLLKSGIVPDFVTSIDFMELNFEKIGSFIGRSWPFSLICTPKVTPLIPKEFEARHLFWAFNKDTPQQWIIDTLGIKDLAPSTSSVAHLSLGSALLMGCNPIVLVGQDLGYTTGDGDHAAGTVIMQNGLPKDREIFYVPGIDGKKIATDRALISLQKIFEDIISANPERTYFNATVVGANISGATPISLAEAADKFMSQSVPVHLPVDEGVAAFGSFPIMPFVKKSQNVVHSLDNTIRQLQEVLKLADFAINEIQHILKRGQSISSLADLPDTLIRKLIKFDKINKTLDSARETNEHVLELTYPSLNENDRLREDNERVKDEQGYLPWLLAEIQRIDMVNRERCKAFSLYRKSLGQLIHHLKQEAVCLKRKATRPTVEQSLTLVRLYCDSGDYVLAQKEMEEVLVQTVPTGQVHLLNGEIKAMLQNFEGAHELWRKAVGESPELTNSVRSARLRIADRWIGMSDTYGNPGETGDNFPQLLPVWLGRVAALLEPDEDPPPGLRQLWQKHLARTDEWLSAGATEEMGYVLQGWEVFGERFPELLVLKARSAAGRRNAAEAVLWMEKAVSHKPNQPEWLTFLARQLLETGRFEEGIVRLQEAVALDPATAVLWEELGDILAAAGDFDGAAMAFERCFLTLPARLNVLLKIGDCYLQSRQPEAAMVAYKAVLDKTPNDESAHLRLARARAVMIDK